MTELKNSAILDKILQNAKQLIPGTNALTVERFFVALFEEISSSDRTEREILDAINVLKTYTDDLKRAQEGFRSYVESIRVYSFVDQIQMFKVINDAKADAQKAGEPELTVGRLVLGIMKAPGETVNKIFADSTSAGLDDIPPARNLQYSIESALDELLGPSEDWPGEDPEEQPQEPYPNKSAMAQLVEEVKSIRTRLKGKIYGQDNAINVFASGYFQARTLSMIDSSRKRPQATFLFAGPPGVGKTFLAEQAAEVLGLPFKRFDMSEYADKEANLEFCGSDKVYKNGKAGNVTSFVAENPRCVLLFDEIEKAHMCVIHLFLQMLDAGRLRDNYTDQEVSFRNAIIILTTNAGKQLYEENESGNLSTVPRKVVIKALQKDINPETGAPYFPAAICSRFASGNVVMFNHIEAHDLRTIARNEILRHAANLEAETGMKMGLDERVFTALLFAEGSAADARTIRSRAESFFNDELYELLRLIASDKTQTSLDSIEWIQVNVDLSNAGREVEELFAPPEKTKLLVFADPETVRLCGDRLDSCNVVGVHSYSAGVDALKDQRIDFVLLDMKCGAEPQHCSNLNIEDDETPARDFFRFLKTHRSDLPIYLLEDRDDVLNEEEEISFLRQGVRGILCVSDADSFIQELVYIAENLHQQTSMIKLAKSNKIVSFETAQRISEDGKYAKIRLFDFKLSVAVDSEDAKNVLSAVSRPNVRFDDVIGARDAKKELTYFVEYLRDPGKYMGTGVKTPKGVLLYGPPGTGKTMLAKAMACEADITFIAAEGNQFLKRYVGEGSEKVHELFKTARKYAPSILFIDEIDAIGKERRGGLNAGAGGEETLTAFLTEMDGFTSDPSRPVFVLAATNFEVEPGKDKSLDPALLRRFDRRVYIDLPNKEDRIRFLKQKIAKNPALVISDAQVETIAMRATGMSLAELDSAVELALRSAIREGSTTVTDAIFEEAFETFNSGEVKKWDISQLERIARHEAGHAIVCWHSGQTPSYLTIVARGSHGGYMQHSEQEGKAIYTKDELLSRIRTSLGGRAAEIVYYGQRDGISTGASGDLASATALAQQIVCAYGMDDEFGLAVVQGAMTPEVRTAVNRILKEQMQEAVRLISENRDKVDSLVSELLTKNHLTGPEIRQAILKQKNPQNVE